MIPAFTPPEVVQRLLQAAGPELVLVGGQALAFWMQRYGVPVRGPHAAISRDVDFLARSADDQDQVRRLARVIGGRAEFPHQRDLTALVGQAVRQVSADEYLNVDVIFRVYGTERQDEVADIEMHDGTTVFRVMHPMHVLKSRLDNLYSLREKQTPLGEEQLAAAIQVARHAQHEIARIVPAKGRSATLAWVKFIAHLARRDAGRKVALRHGIHVADAIEPTLVTEPLFAHRQLPRVRAFMSESRRAELDQTGSP